MWNFFHRVGTLALAPFTSLARESAPGPSLGHGPGFPLPAFQAHPGKLALGPGAQLAARLLEDLGAGFQRGPQLVPLAGRVGAQLLELGGVSPGHLGQAAGSVVKPGEDLVPFPLGVGAQLLKLAGRVLSGPRGLGGGGALVSLRGLRERLVPGVIGGAGAGPGLFVAFGW